MTRNGASVWPTKTLAEQETVSAPGSYELSEASSAPTELDLRGMRVDEVQEILAAGHSVQSHGNLHIRLPNRTREEILEEVQLSLDLIVAAGAPRPTCFRPPYGATNEDVFSVAEELGLEVVLWTVASLDTVHQEPDGIIASTLAVAAPDDVVLMHDHWASAHEIALPIIIESLLEQGVGFGPICVPEVAEPPGLAPSLTRIMDLIG